MAVKYEFARLFKWGIAAVPGRTGVFLRRCLYKLYFKRVGDNLSIAEGVSINGFENVVVGDNVWVFKNSYIYADEGELFIGDSVGINSNVHVGASHGRISIGNGCLIGPNCVLRAADHCFNDPHKPILEQGFVGGEIVLEDDVWLASNVVVIKNVIIGKGSVIGAQSVVTKSLPPYSIAHGVPAKVVGSRAV